MQINTMHAEAARCFRSACETDNPLERALYMSLRQAWLVLARQVEQRAGDQKRSIEDRCSSRIEGADKRTRAGKPNRQAELTMRKGRSRQRKSHRSMLAA
jgi:hypothetical protein